ncbi:Amuc_1099 family pilus-like system protein [Rubritalea spongiae]|uniref:Amuc_1099 family pilus-like system protein n=1 Tax=Rubritalea spongiae TaxID=430797 RepID=A0ABW5E321_9BACT
MSWIEENYEKAALGGAVAILAGVAALSFIGKDDVSAKALSFDRNDDPSVEALAEVSSVLESRSAPAQIREKIVSGREVDLFVGQALYVKEGQSTAVDLYDSENVHQGIANAWWRKYGIDPGYVNSADRDYDKDGFTNREEFVAKTNPADSSAYPNPIAKLEPQGVEVFKMQMRWSIFNADQITLYYQDTKKRRFNERVSVGDAFFARDEEGIKGRFTLVGKVEDQAGPGGRVQDGYEIKDNTPRYKGEDREKFTVWRRGDKPGGFTEVQDLSVEFRLKALDKDNESFIVSEFETFSLPYDQNATERPYRVESIDPRGDQYIITVSYSEEGVKTSKEFIVSK